MKCDQLLNIIQGIASTDGPASFVRENAGAIAIRLLARAGEECPHLALSELNFPADSLTNRRIENVSFLKCYFQSTEITSETANADFFKCVFEHLEINTHVRMSYINFNDCEVRALTLIKSDGTSAEYFDPRQVTSLLIRHGATVSRDESIVINAEAIAEDDEGISFIRKLLTIFGRSFVIGERILAIKFGVNTGTFMSDYLPELLSAGIVEEVPHRGGGYQRNFRLGLQVSEIGTALAESQGSFTALLKALKDRDKLRL